MGAIMNRNMALKILNPVLLVLFVNQALTAMFSSKISLQAFELFHKDGGKILLGLIVAHFILNFNWVKANYFPKKKN